MIDPKQLRVGNKVNFQFNPEQRAQEVTVAWVSDDSIGYKEQHEASYPQSPKSFFGIPLTPEWLERCGFEENRLVLKKTNRWYVEYAGEGSLIMHDNWDESAIEILSNVQYVHQLQNFYFAVTGEELTIKS